MPILPSGNPRPPEHEPHRHRQVAESYGSDPERYDRARPRYPRALVDRVVTAAARRDRTAGSGSRTGPHTPSVPGAPHAFDTLDVLDVLDVGTGTGIVARQFQAAGCRVLGVDVDARMTGFARGSGVAAETAAFEDWDPDGREFDAVVAGQTWHWVDPVAGAAKAAAVLRPGGLLAAFWNTARPSPGLVNAFASVYRRFAPDSLPSRQWTSPAVDGYTALSTRAADGIRRTGSFGAPEEWRFDWEHSYTRDAWLDQLPTQGGHAGMPADQLAAVLAGIGAAVDAVGGSFTVQCTTVAVTAVRAPAAP